MTPAAGTPLKRAAALSSSGDETADNWKPDDWKPAEAGLIDDVISKPRKVHVTASPPHSSSERLRASPSSPHAVGEPDASDPAVALLDGSDQDDREDARPHNDKLHAEEYAHLQMMAEAAKRGAILGTRRLDKTRAELRDFNRRFDATTLTAGELRRLRLDLRRREGILLLLGGLVLVMSALYGTLILSSPQLLGNPRNEFGCVVFGGTWAQSPTGKDYCIFWAH